MVKNNIKKEEYMKLSTRVLSFFLDVVIITIIASPIQIILILFIKSGNYLSESEFFNFISIRSIFDTMNVALFLCKDSFNGRSPGKRILNYQVIDINTKEPISGVKSLIRNTTLFILPIEIILLLSKPQKRIGDYLAKTEIIQFNKNSKIQKTNWDEIILSFIIGILLSLGFSFLMNLIKI